MSTLCQKELERLLECPICVKHYRDPRILSCGHHFCLKCLTPLESYSVTQKIRCPTCREETQLSEGCTAKDLPKPYTFNAIQQQIKQPPKDELTMRSCDLCPDDVRAKASFYCHQCRECLCDQCHVHHNQASALTDHVIDVIGHVRFCDVHMHTDQIVTKYCLNCKAAVCKRCLILGHRNHLSDELQSVATKSREHLQALKEKLETSKADLGQILLSGDVQKRALELGKSCEGVLKFYQTIRENLQHMLDQVKEDIHELNGIFSEHKTEVTTYQANLKTKLNDITDALSDIEKAMTSSSEFGIIADETKLTARFNDDIDLGQTLRSPRPEIPDVFPKYHTLLKTISSSLGAFQRSFAFVLKERPKEESSKPSDPVTTAVHNKAAPKNQDASCYLLMNLPDMDTLMEKLRIIVENIVSGYAVKNLDYFSEMAMASIQVTKGAEISSEDLERRGVHCTVSKLYELKFEENCIILKSDGTVQLDHSTRTELERASGVQMVVVCELKRNTYFIRYNGAPNIEIMKKCSFKQVSSVPSSMFTSQPQYSNKSIIIERVPELVLCQINQFQNHLNYFDERFLRCYLEMRDKSDGGKISWIYKHVPLKSGSPYIHGTSYFIWFAEKEVAERVCRKTHTIDSKSFRICRYIPGFGVLDEQNNNMINHQL